MLTAAPYRVDKDGYAATCCGGDALKMMRYLEIQQPSFAPRKRNFGGRKTSFCFIVMEFYGGVAEWLKALAWKAGKR